MADKLEPIAVSLSQAAELLGRELQFHSPQPPLQGGGAKSRLTLPRARHREIQLIV